MKYTDLTDEQLSEILKLRLENEINEIEPKSHLIEDKPHFDKALGFYATSYILNYDNFLPERFTIVFNKLYPSEFLYLQKIGIDFS